MFDSRVRDSVDDIYREAAEIIRSSCFSSLLEEIPNMIIIMNPNRQIIYMNKMFSREAGKKPIIDSQGMRPGECLMCIHASKTRFGCGNTDFCKICGFARSIQNSERGLKSTGECNITLKKGETLTYRVHTQPFSHKGRRYIFAYLQDISDFKTRQLLENIFLHDINNSITALNGLNEMIDELPVDQTKKIINDLSLRLTDEVHSYRLITEAENKSLSIIISEVNLDDLIDNIIESLLNIRHLRNRNIIHKKSGLSVNTDETLLRRVLINTIKNALEASSEDQEILVFTTSEENRGSVKIRVKSYPLIPKDVQMQIFQRAFSTKGHGRGWGTYSIRLLTERYLGGNVNFVSGEKQRTVFSISIPDLQES